MNQFQLPHAGLLGDDHKFLAPETASGTGRETGPSAAWLAAQHAFRAAEPKQPAAAPVVIVRKPKVFAAIPSSTPAAVSAAGPVAPDCGSATDAHCTPVKAPRVFRIEKAPIQLQDNAPDRMLSAEPLPAPVGAAQAQRLGKEVAHAPGPVVQVYRAIPSARPVSGEASQIALSPAEIGALSSRLREVGRILEQTQAAADFSLDDATGPNAWTEFDADLQCLRRLAGQLVSH